MAVVEWDKPVEMKFDEDTGQELLMQALKIDSVMKWEGKVKQVKHRYSLELRQQFSGSSNVLVVVGYHKDMVPDPRWPSNRPSEDRDICVSMNGKTHLTDEEFYTMTLAIREAKAVLAHLNEQ
jgi:hypothetical protein